MKTLLFLLAVIFSCNTNVFAQFEIDSTFIPVPGNKEITWSVDAEGLFPGNAGENIFWDFSNITLKNDSTVNILRASSLTPYFKDFPSSNIASHSLNSDYYAYYKVSKDCYLSLGNGQKIASVIYSVPQTIMQYPMSYNQSFTSNCKGSGSYNEYKLNTSGTLTVTFDAYGSISLPSGKSDVIRLKQVSINYDTIYANNEVMSTSFFTSITYTWYKKNYRFPIFYIDESSSDRGPIRTAGYVINSATIDNSMLKEEIY